MDAIAVQRAITLTQPWASLMWCGAKVIETRGWPTSYRGWVAIHAAKGFPGECKRLVYQRPFKDVLLEQLEYDSHKELPIGAVCAVTCIVDCRRTEDVRDSLSERERAFGDYSDGRYAFITEGLRTLKRPFAIPGALSIWRLPNVITEADLG